MFKFYKEKFIDLKKLIDEGKFWLICIVIDIMWKNCVKEIGDCLLFYKDFVVELIEKVLDK